MNRISQIIASSDRPLIVSDVCGAPDMQESARRIRTLLENNVEIVNLIVPFSDPMADGAVIQTAAQQALANGADLAKVLDMITGIRQDYIENAFIISGYYNVFLQYGLEKLFARLAELKIDGILINDLPFEERGEIEPLCKKYNICRIVDCGIVSNKERLQVITAGAEGFIIASNAVAIDFVKSSAALPVAAIPALGEKADALMLAEEAVQSELKNLPELLAQYRK